MRVPQSLHESTSVIKNFFSLAPHFLSEASILLFVFFHRVLLRLLGYPMSPHVLRVFILEKASSIKYGYRKFGIPNICACEQQDWNKTIKDKGEEGKKKGMNVERSTVGTKKSGQPKRQRSLNLVQSRQSPRTVHQEVGLYTCFWWLRINGSKPQPASSVRCIIKWLFINLFKLESNIISLKKYMLMKYFGKYTILWILAFFMFYNRKKWIQHIKQHQAWVKITQPPLAK